MRTNRFFRSLGCLIMTIILLTVVVPAQGVAAGEDPYHITIDYVIWDTEAETVVDTVSEDEMYISTLGDHRVYAPRMRITNVISTTISPVVTATVNGKTFSWNAFTIAPDNSQRYVCRSGYYGSGLYVFTFLIDGKSAASGVYEVKIAPDAVKQTFGNGDVYDGQITEGKKNGYGKMTYANGDVYEGQWRDDRKEGYGICTWKSGYVYEGEYQNDQRNGQGKMSYPSGSIYEGEWQDGNRSGYGKMIYSNGDVYEGQWKDDQREGYGICIWKEGYIYEGEYQNDQRNGQGKMSYPSGSIYEGEWQDDNRNGYGKKTYADGTVQEGIWMDDAFSGEAEN